MLNVDSNFRLEESTDLRGNTKFENILFVAEPIPHKTLLLIELATVLAGPFLWLLLKFLSEFSSELLSTFLFDYWTQFYESESI